MPCYEIRTASVALAVADAGVLRRALDTAGFQDIVETQRRITMTDTKTGERVTITEGRVEMSGPWVTQEQVAATAGVIVKAYAAEGMKLIADKYGWNVEQNQETGQYTLSQRSF